MKKLISSIKYISFCLVAGSILTMACKKKNDNTPAPVSTVGKVTVNMHNEVDGQPITFGTIAYTNAAGNPYRIDMMKYYISNFTLIKDDNTEHNFANYKLIDAADSTTGVFTLDSVANGNYTAVRFYLGVDSMHNHTGDQAGDLDPINGMIWSWNTGYIFFKHEGAFRNDTGGTTFLLYHYGTDPGRATVDIPISTFTVKGDNHTLYLKFNLNKVYSANNTVNFTNNNIHQSNLWTDGPWIRSLETNFSGAFSFDKVQ